MSSSEWKKLIIGDIVGINELSITSSYPHRLIEYIDTSSVTNNKFESVQRLTIKEAPSRAKRIVRNGDTIISTVRPIQRHFGYIKNAKENTVVSTGFVVLTPKKIHPAFLYYFMSQDAITNYLNSIAETSTTTFPAFRPETIREMEVEIPESADKQAQIAHILSTIDEKIELNHKTNQTLEAITKAIYKEWFVDFNFPGATGEMQESELGPIPRGWQVVPLGEITDLTWGDTNTTKKSYVNEGYPAYSASGRDGFLSYHDFDRDGIVVSAIGTGKTWLAIGKWSCIKNTIRFWSVNSEISNEYLYLATSGSGFWPLRGSAQPFISQTDARGLKILFPSENIAKTFGEITRPMFKQIEENNIQNNYLEQVRDALLPKLMSGEIEI